MRLVCQQAFSMPCIQKLMKAGGELAVVLVADVFRLCLKFSERGEMTGGKPRISACSPPVTNMSRD